MKTPRSPLIIIPAHNEENNIRGVIEELRKCCGAAFDILVVDDGSTDGTGAILREMNCRALTPPVNLGYGAALQLGYQYAARRGYETVIQLDGDGQHKPADVSGLYQIYLNKNADILIGSRFLKGGKGSSSWPRALGNRFLSLLLYAFTGAEVRDITSGFQILGRDVVKCYSKAGNFPDDYPDVDVLAQMALKGMKIVESEITINERVHGKGMHSGLSFIRYFFKTILSLVMITLRHRMGITA